MAAMLKVDFDTPPVPTAQVDSWFSESPLANRVAPIDQEGVSPQA
jgi:hypothetical protein